MSEPSRTGRAYGRNGRAFAGTGVAVACLAAAAAMLTTGAEARSAATPANARRRPSPGTAVVGETLTAVRGSWTGTPPISYAFAWERCDAAGAELRSDRRRRPRQLAIVGRRGRRRLDAARARDGDERRGLRERRLGTDRRRHRADGTREHRRAAHLGVGRRRGDAHAPRPGTWIGTSITYAYQWVRCGAGGGLPDGSDCPSIPGATGSSYTLVDRRHRAAAPRTGHGVERARARRPPPRTRQMWCSSRRRAGRRATWRSRRSPARS